MKKVMKFIFIIVTIVILYVLIMMFASKLYLYNQDCIRKGDDLGCDYENFCGFYNQIVPTIKVRNYECDCFVSETDRETFTNKNYPGCEFFGCPMPTGWYCRHEK